MELHSYHDLTYIRDRVGPKWMNMYIYLYLLDGVLVDTGGSAYAKRYHSAFRRMHIDKVAITHLHEDHAGSAAWLAAEKGAEIYLHPSSIGEASRDAKMEYYRRFYWGGRTAFAATPFPPVIHRTHADFEVLHTPGHTADHVVLLEKRRGWLFTGDLFVTRRPKIAFKDENMSETIASLEKIYALDFSVICCTHSGVRENGKQLIDEKLNYFYELREKVRSMRSAGMEDETIAKKIFPKRPLISYISKGDIDAKYMIKTI